VAVTNNARSPLTGAAGLLLTTAVYETTYRSGGLAATHSHLIVADLLYIRVAPSSPSTGPRTHWLRRPARG